MHTASNTSARQLYNKIRLNENYKRAYTLEKFAQLAIINGGNSAGALPNFSLVTAMAAL